MKLKKEGFKGQRAIVLPQPILNEIHNNPLTSQLYVTDIGYYPEAHFHFRDRPEGCEQSILVYCVDGNGWVETEGICRKVLKGTFFIIPAGMPHKYGAGDNEPWSIYWLHFNGVKNLPLAKSSLLFSNIDLLESSRNDRRLRLFDEIYQNLSMGYSSENLEYSSICLWYLLGSYMYIPQFERIRSVQQHNIIEKSILHMHDHLEDSINLTDLAELCGYSVSHYSSIFKAKTSRSPIDYYINLKIQKACQLLDFTDMRINEIATQLSFDDQFYFSRVFKKLMGLSPVEYRKTKKG